jgi:Flp pilus assembly CpaF family ATPase
MSLRVILIALMEHCHALLQTAPPRKSCSTLEMQRQLEQVIHDIANDERYGLSGREQSRLAEELANDVIGYGPIEPLLRDLDISGIMVSAPDSVYVERSARLN